MGKLDKRTTIVCEDRELIVSASVRNFDDLANAVRAAGMSATGPEPAWSFGCQQQAAAAPALPSNVPTGSPLSYGPPPVQQASQPIEVVAPVSTYAAFVDGGRSRVDRLLEMGYVPAGCMDDASGDVRVSLRKGFAYQIFPLAEVKRSKAGFLVRCRL